MDKAVAPVPLSGITCMPLLSLSVMVRMADLAPSPLGLNITVTVQLEPNFTLPAHVSVSEKSPASAPLNNRLFNVTVLLPLFVSVIVCEVETLTGVEAKLRDPGDTLRLVPFPVREIVCGLVGSVSLMDTVAVRVPLFKGVNVMVTTQLPWPLRLAGQALEAV